MSETSDSSSTTSDNKYKRQQQYNKAYTKWRVRDFCQKLERARTDMRRVHEVSILIR